MILVVDIGNTKIKIGIYDRKNKEIKENMEPSIIDVNMVVQHQKLLKMESGHQ